MNEESDSESNSPQFGNLAPEEPPSNKKELKKNVEPKHLPKAINLNIMKEKKPRLVIDHMVLQDFKSYAGRQVIGKFHGNFTSVVGPNGSGKSNLIESMLFIFGFNASWMRLNKLNQLIHKSSTSTENSRAAVQVHFKKLLDNDDGSLSQLPDFNLWIRRTVNSSSVSKYYLNGKDSTQGQVKERLKAEGIDLGNNRFLILQGEVEQISQMKQKSGDLDKPGLLEYLEEIIGSNQFIERIEECGREYALAEQQKHEKGQLMKLVENQLKGMSKAKDEAVKFVRKQKKIYQIQNIFNQVTVASAKQELKKLKQTLGELQKTRDRITAEEKQKLRKQAERIKDIKKNKAQMQEVQKQCEKCQQTCNKMQIEDKHITQDVAFKSEDLVKFQRKIGEADKQMNNIISHCEQLKNKLPERKEILEKKSKQVQKMKTELSKYDKPHLRQQIKEREVALSQNDLESNTIRNKLESVRQNLGKIKLGRGELEAKIKQYTMKLEENTSVKGKIAKAKDIAERMIKEKKEKIGSLENQRSQVRNQLRHIENQLREQLNESQEQGQMGNMFREIMSQNFPGVIGRLGDLGQVSKEYDEVITTCCNKLDNIVCTDLESAKNVLDFLKKRKLGRSTCIILDKIGQFRHYMSRPFQNLPRAVRLFDVIKFKTEEAKLAFYFALSDTLYCEDSDLGLEYSMKNDHQRRRVISRNKNRGGYITYEMNGLMSGSGARRGGFDQKAGIKNKKGKDESHIRQLQTRKKDLSSQIDQVSKKIDHENLQISSTMKDLEQMKRELISVDQIIKQSNQQIKDLNVMISKAEGKSDSHQLLQKEIKALEKAESELKSKRKDTEAELRRFQEQQKNNQNEEVQALREKYKQQKAEVNKLEKDSEKQRAQMQNGIKRIDDLKKSKVQTQKTLERLKKDIDRHKNQQLQLEKKVSEILGKMAALDDRLKECKKIESELKMIMDEDEKEVRQSKAKVQKVRKDVQNCQEGCKRKNQDLKFAESELDRIRQNYRELSSSYSFFDELDQIQKMTLAADKNYMNDPPSPRNNSSILQNSMLNSSFDSNAPKVFQIELISKTEPTENINEDLLENFIYFRDRLTGMISTETAALKKMEGNNLEIINEFRSKYTHYRQRLKEFEAVRERQMELKRIIDTLKDQRLNLFRSGFGIINAKLKEVYQHLTRGGDAQLQLIDSLDPFSDGVNFSVRPPKKSWKEVNKLSGGQKTLSSLSLIFALHYYKPTPLYFMDEIDAALDFKNVSVVAEYIKKRTKDAQFIIISLRNNMFDLANKLIGVYKTHDKTKVINLEPAKLLKLQQARQRENMERGNSTINLR